MLAVIAPVGSGFALDAATRRLLLVADAAGSAPLIALAHERPQKQVAVSLLVRGGSGAQPDTTDPATGLPAWLSEYCRSTWNIRWRRLSAAAAPELLGWAGPVVRGPAIRRSACALKESPGLKSG